VGLLDYLKGWDPKPGDGERNNASGNDGSGQVDGQNYDGNVSPSRWDCDDVGQKGSTWGLSQSDLERGYSKPERYDDGQYNQDIPQSNVHDRGSGSASRAAEFKSTEGKGFDGTGHDKPSPGREAMGSSKLVG
jgi:hypothetical protein